MPSRRLIIQWTAAVGALGLAGTGPAHAVDVFEIQVYEGDINQPRQAGLEVHSNFVASGRDTPAFPGEAVPDRALRFTLEPSFGLLPWWELGAYLQLATAPTRGGADFGGFKLRSKFIAPADRTGPFTLGLNIEVGRGVAVLGSADWDTEFRPIVARTIGRWFIALNPILGWALSGDTSAAPELEPCGKMRFDTRLGFAVGLEYYAGLGRVTDIAPAAQQQHIAYLVTDLIGAPFDLNVGLGRGLTDASEPWSVKAILGAAF